ncbi:hypothetical protein E6H36_09115 [Candidatus Bathyarchaeota archaeon]|nr:MAG: hypothetical protein E6H36_09115 [Candidatus Bathyarchaeota archaeon]TMI30189.1 MAG: hypothetical protein E6H29_09460 [Candidatus Bathyarchaeota archaeon]
MRDVAEFVKSKVKTSVRAQGSRLQFDMSAREAKLLLHKYLHHRGLDGYRVEVVHPGMVEVFSPEHTRPHATSSVRGSPPSAAVTMPYEFPFSPSLPGSAVRKKSKKR